MPIIILFRIGCLYVCVLFNCILLVCFGFFICSFNCLFGEFVVYCSLVVCVIVRSAIWLFGLCVCFNDCV